ncbi:hypothetical protein [Nocardia sp. NPDC051570]|uniref:hypothetical protein n=1 Tax=Nocardia sp. NPDC051570 TaxID=3364324 RepID=UPI00378993A9
MPTHQHESLVELFRSQPMLAAWYLMHVFGEKVPDYERAHAEPCDFTDVGPKEFRGDSAFALYDGNGRALIGICVEIQRGYDDSRHWKWPVYLATLRSRLQCPTYLLVIAPKLGVAAWCRRPIDLGHPGLVLRPLVLGPDRIPAVTDPVEAVAVPERAVLSAIAHGEGPDADAVLTALLAGLHETGDEQAKMYYDMVAEALSVTARHRLEELMALTYEYQSDFARRYVAEGVVAGEARLLLAVLDSRGISISQDAKDRITSCKDPDQLEMWGRRASTVDSVDQLFD